jgi:uncharacterized protein
MLNTNKIQTFPIKNSFGLGYRPKYYQTIKELRPKTVDWFEVVTENFILVGGMARDYLIDLRDNYPIAFHGVSLNIAGADPICEDYLKGLRGLIDEFSPFLVSDHLCWTSHRGWFSYDLLPFAMNEMTLKHVSKRVQLVQEALRMPIALENPSAYLCPKDSDIPEWQFLNALAERTGCGILLDLNNLYVNAKNLGYDALSYLRGLNPQAVKQFHLAGHTKGREILIDTHDRPVCEDVWDLYGSASALMSAPTLLEWDANFPALDVLIQELQRAREISKNSSRCAKIHPFEIDTEKNSDKYDMPVSASGDFERHLRTLTSIKRIITSDEARWPVSEFCASIGTDPRRGAMTYNQAYFLRIHECLQEDFPLLYAMVGEGNFRRLVSGYLQSQLPAHYSLNYLGSGFAEWLDSQDSDFTLHKQAITDIARFEWMRTELHLAANGERLIPWNPSALTEDDWQSLRIRFHKDVKFQTFSADVASYFEDFSTRKHQKVVANTKSTSHAKSYGMLLYRHEGQVIHRSIDARKAQVFQRMSQGKCFAKALAPIKEPVLSRLIVDMVQEIFQLAALGLVTRQVESNQRYSQSLASGQPGL